MRFGVKNAAIQEKEMALGLVAVVPFCYEVRFEPLLFAAF